MTRNMPPWHLDKTVGIQQFQNDFSLSDEQIATIVRWVDGGAPMGDPKDMPPPKQWPQDDGWRLAKELGREPDLVIESEPYTMPAKGQDVWFRPLTPIPLDEPRWVRAVEMRPATPAGRRITHHALALLQQEEPGSNAGARQPRPADGMGHQQELRHLPAKHRKAAGSRRAHLVGDALSCGGRGDPRPCPTGDLFLSRRIRSRITARSSLLFPPRPGAPARAIWIFHRIRSPRPKVIRRCGRRRVWKISSRICTCAAKPCCSRRFCPMAPDALSAM